MAHPYRAPVVAAPRRALDSTAASFFPLAAMALAFFLPVMTIFGGELVITPIGVALSGAHQFLGIAPTYAGAALLALGVLAGRARLAAAFATFAVAITVASCAYALATSPIHSRMVFANVPVAVAMLVALRAWRRAFGERRLALLIDAFALASVPLVVLNVEVAHRAGAWLFVCAWLVLAGVRVRRALA